MSTLEKKLDSLIARQDHVSPEDVTLEHIHRQREARVYPNAEYDFTTRYGGYNRHNLRVLTPVQFQKKAQAVYEYLSAFTRKKI